MDYRSTLNPQFNDSLGNDSSYTYEANVKNQVIESFHLAFTVLGIAIGISGIGFNTALLVLTIGKFPSSLSLQTRNLIASLAAADLFLLLFGLPYELIAANNYPWLEGKIGCKMSAFLPEASRFVWMGTVLLSLPDHWPSLLKLRRFVPAWTTLIWVISLAISIPFGVYSDCLGLLDIGFLPETLADPQQQDGACICVLTFGQTVAVQMFGSSLVAFLVIPVLAILKVGWKSRCVTTEDDQTGNLIRNTSSKTLAVMLFIFMICTLPRYIYIIADSLELPLTTYGNSEWVKAAIQVLCHCLFFLTSIIHMVVSPHPRSLLRQLVHHRQEDCSI